MKKAQKFTGLLMIMNIIFYDKPQNDAETFADRFKKFFTGLRGKINELGSEIQAFVDAHIMPAIKTVQVIKLIVDNPAMDFLTAMTQTDMDDKLIKLLRTNLVKVIAILNLKAECGSKKSNEEKIKCYIEHIAELSPELRGAIYHKTASLMAQLSKGKEIEIEGANVDALTQLTYNNLVNAG